MSRYLPPRFWQFLFFLLVAGYCLYYAPYGINETDGGFLTGLAWQIVNGKVLYADVVYVRPPLPIWLRALELKLLPESGAILAERWIFYFKVALYSWLGVQVLAKGKDRWMLAVFGFILSAHCYPAAAWHTVDGILFGALSVWFWTQQENKIGAILSGVFLMCCVLCKQSFYPMVAVWTILLAVSFSNRNQAAGRVKYAVSAFLMSAALFCIYLYANGLWNSYLSMTGSSASGGQAFQHGILDYLRINPWVAAISAIFLTPLAWWALRQRGAQTAFFGWILFLFFLLGSCG